MVKVCGKAASMGHLLALAAIVQMLFLVLLLPSHERDSFRHSLSQSFASSSGSLRNVFAMSSSVTKLPSFAQDSSELVLSSVLERSSTSSDMFVTTFLLSKSVLDPFEKDKTMSVKGISATSAVTVKTLIEKQSKLSYDVTGNRKSPPHFCLIKLDKSSNTKPQSVPAHFLPNRLTSDFHSNRKIDILRCPLQSILNASTSIYDYIDGHRSLEIEIYREETFLTSFDIPWRSRSTGYLFSAPPTASQLQAWHGLNRRMGPRHDQGHESLDTVHLCVANSKSKSLYHLAEFLEHHKRIGVQHVYYSLPFAWKTKSMHRILSSLSDYVNEGFLSVQSSADQYLNPNLVTSAAEGIYWHDYTERVIQINSCLYIAKGNANYVGIWDVNDLFVPSNPKFTLVDILLAHNQERLRFNSGFADKTGGRSSIHVANTTRIRSFGAPNGTIMSRPDCFISVALRHVYPNVVKITEQESRRIWLSSQYDVNNLLHSTSRETGFKYFIPTELIFQGGMHTPGGCRMPSAPRVCGGPLEEGTHSNLINGFCLRRTRNDVQYNNHRLSRPSDFDALGEDFAFDDVVLQGDGSSLSRDVGGGMIYSFEDASENEVVKTQGSPMDLHNRLQTSDNIYGQYFSSLVERTLNSKSILSESLEIPIHRPLPADLTHDVNSWEKFELRYRNNFNAIIQPDISNTALDADKTNPLSAGSLPSFVTDGSDVCLGSLIERQHDSFKLHISTFFIQHELLYMPPEGYGFLKIRNDRETQQQWKKAILAFNDTHYSHTGQRLATPRYFCRVSVKLQNDSLVNLSMKARNVLLSPYSIQGEFMPNSLTVDKNANRRVDILRCPVRHSKLIHATNLPSSAEVLTVEIYREKNFLISFEIPWVTRRTGFSLSVPKQASKFNAWQNFPQNSRRTDSRTSEEHELLKSDSQDYNDPVVHMCVPGFETHISQRSLTVYAEFLQHHILIGANHMFVAGPYAWGGQNMANFLAAFRTFIDEGKLTVSSLAESTDEEYLYSILGATIDRDNVKVFHVSSCLYLSKGVADYVAVWDNDEFFIPKPPHSTIQAVIRTAESTAPLTAGSTPSHISSTNVNVRAGWADGDMHPFCFLYLSSQVIYSSSPSDFDYFSPNRDSRKRYEETSDFLGDQFRHLPETKRVGLAFQKSILPTRLIFQAGLHVGAACRLPPEWTYCNNSVTRDHSFCYSTNALQYRGYLNDKGKVRRTSPYQNFDTLVENKDAHHIPKDEATLYHIQMHRYYIGASPEAVGRYKINDYSRLYFPSVIKELKRRHLFELLTSSNFQTLYESGNFFGQFLSPPDENSTVEYIANHNMLQTLLPSRIVMEEDPGKDLIWVDFNDFYDSIRDIPSSANTSSAS